MKTALDALLDYSCSQITAQDIIEHSFSDPGYPEYVRIATEVFDTKYVATKTRLSGAVHMRGGCLIECINLTNCCTTGQPVSFRRYRIFTNTIGLILSSRGVPYDAVPSNRVIANLLFDAQTLEDRTLLTLLYPAFTELCISLNEQRFGLTPFVLLGKLLLCFMGYGNKADIPDLATQIIEEESRLRHESVSPSKSFLWDLVYDNSESVWRVLIEQSFPHENQNEVVRLLRASL